MMPAGDSCHEAMEPAWTAIEGFVSKGGQGSSQGCVLGVLIWHPYAGPVLYLIGESVVL